MKELKSILREVVNDLEEIRVVLAKQSAGPASAAGYRAQIASELNREPYNALRKRIDALKLDA